MFPIIELADISNQKLIKWRLFYWKEDNPDGTKNSSYRQLHDHVCQLANVMQELSIQKKNISGTVDFKYEV